MNKNILKEIRTLFSQYSFKDVSNALCVSDLWPLNQSSDAQHHLWTGLMIAMPQDEFKSIQGIASYQDYCEFIGHLYALTNCLLPAEDYVPNLEWAEIKYPIEGELYSFFSGSIETMYDSLTAYEMTLVSLDSEFQTLISRSPKAELLQVLRLQTAVVNAVDLDMDDLRKEKIQPGDKRIPPQYFWQQINEFLKKSSWVDFLDKSFIENMSITAGNFSQASLLGRRFMNKILSGNMFNYLFTECEDSYYPLLPRSHLMILMDEWGRIFEKWQSKISESKDLQKDFSISVAKLLASRVNANVLLPFISAFDAQNSVINEVVFSTGIAIDDKLLVFYSPRPSYNVKDIESEIRKALPNINKAHDLFNSDPLLIADHTKQTIKQVTNTRGTKIKPVVFIIIHPLNSAGGLIRIREKTPAICVTLTQLIALIELADDINQISDFIDFRNENPDAKIVTGDLIDIFSAFIESKGAITYHTDPSDLLCLDPHGSANSRHSQLREFWKEYPPNLRHPDPKCLQIIKETGSFNIIKDKADPSNLLAHVHVDKSSIFLYSPFDIQTDESGKAMELIMRCLADYWEKHKFIRKHRFFAEYPGAWICLFPLKNKKGIILKDQTELQNAIESSKYGWQVDFSDLANKHESYIRVVVDTDQFIDQMLQVPDNRIEIEIIEDILRKCSDVIGGNDDSIIFKKLTKLKGRKPRHKFHSIEKNAAFPEESSPIKKSHFQEIRVNKKISEIARAINLKSGTYSSEEAEDRLNKLREALVEEIDNFVNRFNYEKSLPFCIGAMESSMHSSTLKKTELYLSRGRDVDFDRKEEYINEEQKFLEDHRSFRYLIEKFVQLRPSGTNIITDKDINYLTYMIYRLLSIYNASDMIHYIDHPLVVHVSETFAIFVDSEDSTKNKNRLFLENSADVRLTEGTNDYVESYDPEEYIDNLDEMFESDLGFAFSKMLGVLEILSQWPNYAGKKESTSYRASRDRVRKICMDNVKNTQTAEIEAIIGFLELDGRQILKIKGDLQRADDLPVWESNKRLQRYNLRPLIKIKNTYFWGAYGAYGSKSIWRNALLDGRLPAEINGPKTISYLEDHRRKREKLLEKKALEVVLRYTPFAANVNYARKTHPESLGDYDVLAYIADKNILLNIECKDIAAPLVIKDMKNLKEKIFGTSKKKGSIFRTASRAEYLKSNIDKFKTILGWPIGQDAEIISIHVSRTNYWLTIDAEESTGIKFERIDLLSQLLESIVST